MFKIFENVIGKLTLVFGVKRRGSTGLRLRGKGSVVVGNSFENCETAIDAGGENHTIVGNKVKRYYSSSEIENGL